jgi:hypothetical protein
MAQKHEDPCLIYIHDFDKEIEGTVGIYGRITHDALMELQEYVKANAPGDYHDSDVHEQIARKWLEDHGYDVMYPLYWEQIYL